MRIFITGGSGFLGGHLIEALCQQTGHEVLAMARSERSAAKVEALGATASRCALGAVPAEALRGVDAVIHAAAYVEEYGPREAYFSANVEGTRQLLEAARAAGVGRFILVGTEAALFADADLIDIDETAPYPDRHRFLYSESKAEAERLVLSADAEGFTTLCIRPRLIWGPRDASVLPAIKRIAEDGGWFWLDGGRAATSTAHVYNVVHALILALTRGRGGQAYFISDDEQTTYRSFLTRLSAAAGFSLPDRSLPAAVVRWTARLVEGLWRLLGIRQGKGRAWLCAGHQRRGGNEDRQRGGVGQAPRPPAPLIREPAAELSIRVSWDP